MIFLLGTSKKYFLYYGDEMNSVKHYRLEQIVIFLSAEKYFSKSMWGLLVHHYHAYLPYSHINLFVICNEQFFFGYIHLKIS